MNKDYKFLMLFSFAGYFVIQLITKSLGPPYEIIRRFFASKLYGIDIDMSVKAIQMSTINTIFYIVLIWFFIFTIKRIRDNGQANAIRMLINIIIISIVFLVIDLCIAYASKAVLIKIPNVYTTFTSVMLLLSALLYTISLVVVANSGSISIKSLRKYFNTPQVPISILAALVLRVTPDLLLVTFKNLVMNKYVINFAIPLLISFSFFILVKPIIKNN